MLEHIEDSDVEGIEYIPTYAEDEAAVKLSCKGVLRYGAVVLEMYTTCRSTEGCSILSVPVEDLPKLRNFLVLAVLQLDKLIEKRA